MLIKTVTAFVQFLGHVALFNPLCTSGAIPEFPALKLNTVAPG
jgi:hypothetical protein